jgi:thymidine kinase
MVIDSLGEVSIENYIEKAQNQLEIIRYKTNVVKNIFNFRELVVPYTIVLSSDSGINLFITYLTNITTLDIEIMDIIDSYENFRKVAFQELSKNDTIRNLDIHFYAYFPNLSSDFFKENLFTDETNSTAAFLKQSIDNPIGEIKYDVTLPTIIRSQICKNDNTILKNNEVIVIVLSIFTNNTSLDMGSLVLDEKVNDSRVSSMLKRFELDDSQIHKIETQNSENRIILAEAGTGKSVILFSKAQRIAALNPGKRILILAYNNYLIQETVRKREFENIKASEIDILTVDRYIEVLYQKYVIEKVETEKYDKSGKIKQLLPVIDQLPKYDGIFIDEIQQFRADWIGFLFNMLNSHDKGKYCFILCGDINQSSSESEKTPAWKQANLPSFQGRRIKLDVKYRSTESINTFTGELVKNIYTLYARNKMKVLYELEGEETYNVEIRETELLEDIVSITYEDVKFFHTSFDPKLNSDVIENCSTRASDVVDYIVSLRNDNYDLRELVILYPYQKIFGIEYVKNIEDELRKRDIHYESTRDNDENEYITYDQIKSTLAITSIEKCIGLDFKYVMIIGLDTFGTYPLKPAKNVRYESENENLDYDFFRRQISQFYIALTRAKKKLFVEIPANYTTRKSRDDMFRKILLGD